MNGLFGNINNEVYDSHCYLLIRQLIKLNNVEYIDFKSCSKDKVVQWMDN